MATNLREWQDWLRNRWTVFSSRWLRRPSAFYYLLIGAWLGGLGLVLGPFAQSNRADWNDDIYSFGGNVGQLGNPPPPSSVNPPIPAGSHLVEGTPSVGIAKIEEVLRSYGSPAVGQGQALYELGLKYGINPAYALAFFVHESSAGTKGIAATTRSLGNIRQTASSGFESYQGFRKYPDWRTGFEDWYRLIKTLYIQNWHLRTVEAIIPTYAPAADHNDPTAYIAAVTGLVESWRTA